MAALWRSEEEDILVEIVLKSCNRGVPIADAFVLASKKLHNRTSGACSEKWYQKFQEMYEEEISNIKKQVKRTNNYVGGWTSYQEEKFIGLMVKYTIEGKGTIEAIELCANEFGRSPKSCENYWYREILKKNKLTIENLIEEGKKKMVTITIARTWTNDEEDIAYNMMKNLIAQGVKNDLAWEKVAKRLDFTLSQVRNYWYSYLYPENKNEIDAIRLISTGNYQRQIDKWPTEKQYELYKIVVDGRESNQKMLDIMAIAAATLHCSQNECHNIWYNHVKDNKDFEKQYNEEKVSKQQKAEIVKPKVELPKEEVKEQQLELDLSKADDFLNLVQKLVKQNEELAAENKQLKGLLIEKNAELDMANEFKENYTKMMQAIEKARKIMVDVV